MEVIEVSFIPLQLKTLSKLDYEGFSVILNKKTGEHVVLCSFESADNFLSQEEEEKEEGLETRFFKFMCGTYTIRSPLIIDIVLCTCIIPRTYKKRGGETIIIAICLYSNI